MSMLISQANKLRSWADQLSEREGEFGVVVRALIADLREAADTITILSGKLQGVMGTRYCELFGTPERAARTLHEAEGWTCTECPIRNQCKANWPHEPCPTNDYDSLLEWLRSDAE